MNKLLIIGSILIFGCASPKSASTVASGAGDTRTQPVKLINDRYYLLTDPADDKGYGYEKSNPVKVGGSRESSGPTNERRYLNALLGPNGEDVSYSRSGSCCAFETPNGMINNTGMLDRYRVTWKGSKDTVDIYLNMYDKGDLKIPFGFTAKK